MGTWAAALGAERSDETLAELRASAAKQFDIDAFSCDDCSARKTCEWAFDPYNTNGDCLAEK
jgi:MoaA/NifB/PqqE/SkfB family radical SAM enzyme